MLPPGAPRSGLKLRSGEKPVDEKDEIRPPVELVRLVTRVVQERVTGPVPSLLLIARPSAELMETTGIVGVYVGAETAGDTMPAALLYSTTPIAPAFSAFCTLIKNEQVPRRISAIIPLKLPACNAEQPSLLAVPGFTEVRANTADPAMGGGGGLPPPGPALPPM